METNILISDFSLHSVGVILFRQKKPDLFRSFIEDLGRLDMLVSLDRGLYGDLPAIMLRYGTDFDDSYQYLLARSKSLTFVTLNRDFQKFNDIDVISP